MDISEFQLLKEDEGQYHIQYPSGKSFRLDKKGLSEKAHAIILKLKPQQEEVQNFKSGGAVEESPVAEAKPQAEEPSAIGDIINSLGFQAEPTTPQPQAMAEVGPSSVAPVQPQAPQVPQADPLVQNTLDKSSLLGREEAQAQQYVNAQKAGFGAEQGYYKQFGNQSQAENNSYQKDQAALKAKDDALLNAFTSQKVDPNRYLGNQSTGSKIAAGIGMLISGLGAGVTGKSNMAADYLNKAIENDIESQKNDQSKSMNLYKMNREAYGDNEKAHIATQNQLLTGLQAKINMATSGLQGSKAQLEGQQMINQIEQQKIQNRMHLGLLNQGTAKGPAANLSGADPAVLVPMFIKDPGQQKVAFDEIQRAQNMAKNRKQMLEDFNTAASGDTLKDGQTILSTVTHLNHDVPAIKSLKGLIATQLKGLDGTAREFAMHNAEDNFLPAKGDAQATVDKKRSAFESWLDSESAAPTIKGASGGAIDLSKFSSTAVPQDVKTKTVNGIKYARGPNGEAIRVQ